MNKRHTRRPNPANLVSLVVAGAVFLFAAQSPAQPDCKQDEPADAFSAHVAPLLTNVEGSGYPGPDNLAGWHRRKGEIQEQLAEILELSGTDPARRNATVELILATESLSADDATARRLIERTRGEARAWMRRVLRTYESLGVTKADKAAMTPEIVTEFRATWNNLDLEHPERSLAMYQAKADALRALARFEQPPECLDAN